MKDEGEDQVRFGPTLSSGEQSMIRRRGEHLEVGLISRVVEGRPIREGAELVHIEGPERDGWYSAETLYRHPGGGPARVATPAYREGYDRIFGKQKVGLA